jgi:hypothetical protein
VSAAILDHRRNPTGISGSGWDHPAGVGRKYRDCDLDYSYAESFRASYALGPPANSSEGSCSAGDFSVSQTRVWNLLIDVVAQSGRYPPGETDPKKFIAEGEQHYWVHVAIDRFTGQVIDRQVEVVKE